MTVYYEMITLRLSDNFSHTSRGRACVLRPTGVPYTLLTQSYTQLSALSLTATHSRSLTLQPITNSHYAPPLSQSHSRSLTSLNAQLQILHFLCGGHFSIHAPSAAINLMYYIRQIYTGVKYDKNATKLLQISRKITQKFAFYTLTWI